MDDHGRFIDKQSPMGGLGRGGKPPGGNEQSAGTEGIRRAGRVKEERTAANP